MNVSGRHFIKVTNTRFSSSWFAVDQAVRLSLGECTYPEFTGQMTELSAQAVRLRTDRPLACGSAVRLSWNGTLVSAEVRKCLALDTDFLIEFGLQGVARTQTLTAASAL